MQANAIWGSCSSACGMRLVNRFSSVRICGRGSARPPGLFLYCQNRLQTHIVTTAYPLMLANRSNSVEIYKIESSKLTIMLWHQVVRLPELFPDIFIPVTAAIGIIFALFLWWRVSAIKVRTGQRSTGEDGRTFLLEEELTGEDSVRSGPCCANLTVGRSRQTPLSASARKLIAFGGMLLHVQPSPSIYWSHL